jgi:anthranilate/para-aminobenzoate synthase component I
MSGSPFQLLVAEAATSGAPFACLCSARGDSELGRRSLLATGLRPVLTIEAAASLAPAAATKLLRAAAAQAFREGAKGCLLLVAHEGGRLFDEAAGFEAWDDLPLAQLWAADEVVSAPAGEPWAGPAERPLLRRLSVADEAWHRAAVEAILEAIRAGRLYQLCLTFPLWFEPPASMQELFAWMMANHPVDFGALVQLPDFAVASSSPERFLSLRDGIATARPMKGTRLLVPGNEQAIMAELAASEKDRAENTMIVDLLRNDLSRVCTVERYRSVAQLTSTVTGELSAGRDIWDLLAAAFPPGSMTGAPKLEACAMLRELEQGPRGLYGGTIGWLEPNGDAELSVVIRTMQLRKGRARWDVGGGIVYDSDPRSEWEEAWAKVALLGQRP